METPMTERELTNLFIRLVSHTTPYGCERQQFERLFAWLMPGGWWDEADNFIVQIGCSDTLFCCHTDTASRRVVGTRPLLDHGVVTNTRGRSCLGADDKAGMLCLIAMIKAGVPGTYIFHAGEEVGCWGARHIADTWDLARFKRAIEFDRKGKTSVISHMHWRRTCSDAFAEELCAGLGCGFRPDAGGVMTDALVYAGVILEVTNISVGYERQHTQREFVDVAWLTGTLIPAVCGVDWETLPIRDGILSRLWHDTDECALLPSTAA